MEVHERPGLRDQAHFARAVLDGQRVTGMDQLRAVLFSIGADHTERGRAAYADCGKWGLELKMLGVVVGDLAGDDLECSFHHPKGQVIVSWIINKLIQGD